MPEIDFAPLALTFDDVLLQPGASDVIPADASVATRLSRRITLSIPLVSSAMDTVTESRMAIAMARQGGLGVLHRNLSIDEQAHQIDVVKRSEAGMVSDPVTTSPDATLAEVDAQCAQYRISGLPVVDADGVLVGIVTNRDLRWERPVPRRARGHDADAPGHRPLGATPTGAKRLLQENKIEKLPLVDGEGRLAALITIATSPRREVPPYATKDEFRPAAGRGRVGFFADLAPACRARRSRRGCGLRRYRPRPFDAVLDVVRGLKAEQFRRCQISSPATWPPRGCKALVDAGADGVKMGVGPGSICTTRIIAGIGVPQLTAIHEAPAAWWHGRVPLIGDGGVQFSGDVVKALVAGAAR